MIFLFKKLRIHNSCPTNCPMDHDLKDTCIAKKLPKNTITSLWKLLNILANTLCSGLWYIHV